MAFLIKRFITFIIFILIGFIFYKKVIKRENIFSWGTRKSDKYTGDVEKMEKDPVCGTYVPVKNSLKLKSDGEMYHFCSDKCRKEYISRLNK